jgi:acyl-[acyl-carrier-protein]-phospholipid O-acyltransferase/long-chain-fatty-acid--[acyl-carrier-protein] ligase
MTRENEIIGVMTPNAAPTLGLILGLSAIKRVPAMLNYTAGVDGIQAACTAANITKIITSRAFIEKARLQSVVDRLSAIEVYYLEDLKGRFNWTDRLWVMSKYYFPRSALAVQGSFDPAIVLFTSGSEVLGLPELAVPRVVVTLNEIPALGTGKTDYVRLKNLAETGGQSAMTELAEVP